MPFSDAHLLYTLHLPVRWGDMDALGHVNNSRYFTYFEQARVDWLAALGVAWGRASGPVVASARCDYKRPVTVPATLEVRLYAEAPRRSSVLTRYEVCRTDAPDVLCAVGEATLVWVDLQSGRPVRLPEALRAHLPAAEF